MGVAASEQVTTPWWQKMSSTFVFMDSQWTGLATE
jgi:hypothetical protein